MQEKSKHQPSLSHNDEKKYLFHEKDVRDRCFVCEQNANPLLVFRHVASMKLVHLCQECAVENLSDYMLDNTRRWLGDR